MQSTEKQPLILTLKMDDKNQAFFDQQRKQYFPPERNYLKAHLTLFHQLPDTSLVRNLLSDFRHEVFSFSVTGLMSLGRGVAYKVESTDLRTVHVQLRQLFGNWLIPQDRQGLHPHITIQNKVSSDQAKQLLNNLSQSFKPFRVEAVGLDLWTYLGGPWQHEQSFYFNSKTDQH